MTDREPLRAPQPSSLPDTPPPSAEQDRVSRLSSKPRLDPVSDFDVMAADPAAKRKRAPRSYSAQAPTKDERMWATLAHASAWFTIVGAVTSLGVALPLLALLPLVIYLLNRRTSEYVAFHALQALLLQLVGTVGALTLLVVGGIVWMIGMAISAMLVVVLVGLVLVPLWSLVGIVFFSGVLLLPLVMLVLATIAAVQTNRGHDYRYPYIADWVDRQLAGGLLNA